MPIRNVLEPAKTLARSRALTTIYGTLGGYDPSGGIPALSSLVFIGGVSKLMVPINRGTAEFRELNASTFGRILEQVPGLVDLDTVTLQSVITYGGTFLERCGFQGHMLDFQAYPMLFLLDLPTPNKSKFPARQLILEGAIIKKNPIEFGVDNKEDLRILQEIELAVSNVREIII